MFSFLVVCVGLFSGCHFQPLARSAQARFVAVPEQPEVLRFEATGFNIELTLDCVKRRAHWKFRNNGLSTMVLSHQMLQLHHVTSGRSYYLWGLPWQEDQAFPPIDVKPGTYIGLSYTLPVHGEFRRFCAAAEEPWQLHLAVDRKNGKKQWRQSLHNVWLWSGDGVGLPEQE
ncbi:hypothetical protein [Acanthopleuribacter pedis]|uniref:Uncharacterized protein n=1 Tax=Acanthopleuribacter pedis TaxID=442870 RepID=A0A8J7Q3S5_9BACT|nr:hypothetical protein [Acanthopleuribacter pedis]MBO1317547.1 hypothetical protein [Acanthopleuribacter pedis]